MLKQILSTDRLKGIKEQMNALVVNARGGGGRGGGGQGGRTTALTYTLCRDLRLYPGPGSHYSVTMGKFLTLSVPVSHVMLVPFRVIKSSKILHTKH